MTKERSERFHSIVMKLLWICKRSRPDIEPAISFLCTRNHEPKSDDWRKLKRVLQYIYGTIDDKRHFSASSLMIGKMNSWVDVSYATHDDMRSHTGACISIGNGTIQSTSGKQKLNVKISTEGEVVGASDNS